MSYHQALGISFTGAIELGGKVISDPFLSEFACEANRFSNADKGLPAGPPCAPTAAVPSSAGIGLHNFVAPLRVYTFHKQNPWVFPAGVAAIAGLVYYLGFEAGKGRK